jgi:hypothetical protein
MALKVINSGNLTSAVAAAGFNMQGAFEARLSGTFSATVELQRSFDDGVTYQTVSRDSSGNAASFTAPADLVIDEPASGVKYRWNCTAYTSGNAAWTLAQG